MCFGRRPLRCSPSRAAQHSGAPCRAPSGTSKRTTRTDPTATFQLRRTHHDVRAKERRGGRHAHSRYSFALQPIFPTGTMDESLVEPPVKVYENTYIMKPSEAQRFKRSAAEKVLHEVLEEKMAFTNERDKKGRLSFVYNSDDSGETIREIVEDCQKKVIAQMRAANNDQPPRYKFVIQATMGENHSQMIRNALALPLGLGD